MTKQVSPANGGDSDELVLERTRQWVLQVVIGFNFCPFARKVFEEEKIAWKVQRGRSMPVFMEGLKQAFAELDQTPAIETTLIIWPDAFPDFLAYWEAVSHAENYLRKLKYTGIYQLASFHPTYCFAGSTDDDAANYTNRSPYPMIHILRESGLTEALKQVQDAGKIPERNIHFAHTKGLETLQKIWHQIRYAAHS